MRNVNDSRNLVLVGMPGAGKSTIGVLLAKALAMDFIDTDLLIQIRTGTSLQEILDQKGYLALRQIEEETILATAFHHHVIATGGSAVYSAKAMSHLKKYGTVIYLAASLETISKRVTNFDSRGIASQSGQTLAEIYREREPLYQAYTDITIDTQTKNQDELVTTIVSQISPA